MPAKSAAARLAVAVASERAISPQGEQEDAGTEGVQEDAGKNATRARDGSIVAVEIEITRLSAHPSYRDGRRFPLKVHQT